MQVKLALLIFSPTVTALVLMYKNTSPSLTDKFPISQIPVSGLNVPLVVV